MFTALGHLVVRRRRAVIAISLVGLLVAITVGVGVFGRLSTGGFADPASESSRATDLLAAEFGTGGADLVAIVTATSGTVDDPDIALAGGQLTADLAAETGTDEVTSYWSLGSPEALRSDDATRALVLLRFPGADDDAERTEHVEAVLATYDGLERDDVRVDLAGGEAVFTAIGETIEGDLARAEAIAVPLTLLLLLVVFGSAVAAGLPVLVGMISVFGAFFVLYLITLFTEVSIFSINLVTALGLGLAIDYSLFIVSRFREERERGRTVEDAVVRTVETAGRTVAFSATTVAISLSALLIFPLYFLRSFAYGGIGVILVAMLISVVVLPALLAVLGPKVDAGRIIRRRVPRVGDGVWHRLAVTVMRRPIPVAVAGVTLLVALGLPFLGVRWGTPDDRVLPESAPVREASEMLRTEFTSAEGDAYPIVAIGAVDDAAIAAYAAEVSTVDGVGRVDSAVGRFADGAMVAPVDPSLARFAPESSADGDVTWFNVVPSVEPISTEAEAMIAEVRDVDSPFELVAVGGASASFVDSNEAIFSRVPLAAGLIVVSTFVLLFLMFGSLLVPLKAIVLNTLSLTAVFGFTVWVFQDGNGADLLGFTPTGLTDTAMPILMFCVAFGLSMDYEVFLLSRMKEEYDRTGDNDLAVATGLERTGRLVTAAALLLSITFFAFATSGVTFIKLFGLGLAIAVLVDAFIVRSTLVPALMKLAGDWNWWAPGPLRRLHDRIGLSEGDPPDEPGLVVGSPSEDVSAGI
ncbi:MMPL family transporter [Ilumatobacter nonamiensis]|uniref:MMPL family transporter n=1 Tax=Ilumatobacter nonamiensis TaxID=467093 RepID=UPI000347948D|nr:MMPL family transporter [Ilumatobacter nonamiensis]